MAESGTAGGIQQKIDGEIGIIEEL